MIFGENAPRPPPSARAPRYFATCVRHAAKLQRPRAMRLIRSIACDRAPLNRNRSAANLGEHVKRNKETREPRTDRGLSHHRFFQPVSGSLNVVSVEVIEDFEVLFITFADLRCQNRTVQCPLGSGDRWTRIAGIAHAFGGFSDETHWFSIVRRPRFVAHFRHSFIPTMSVSFARLDVMQHLNGAEKILCALGVA